MPDSPIQQIVCCMGQPVAGNPTQFMIERAFAAAGLDWRYLTLEVPPEKLADAVKGLRAMGFRGGNFTIPHKVAVIPYLDELSEAATLMGAVNCVNRVGEKLLGENTDGKGFVQSLRQVTDPAGKRVVILGAGGAAVHRRRIGFVGCRRDCDRQSHRGTRPDAGRAVERAGQGRRPVGAPEQRLQPGRDRRDCHQRDFDRVGGRRGTVPLQLDSLRSGVIVADVVFNPPQTRLIRDAAARDCTTLDGLGMLVNQGVIGFKIWTGVDPDAEVMRESLEEYLEI